MNWQEAVPQVLQAYHESPAYPGGLLNSAYFPFASMSDFANAASASVKEMAKYDAKQISGGDAVDWSHAYSASHDHAPARDIYDVIGTIAAAVLDAFVPVLAPGMAVEATIFAAIIRGIAGLLAKLPMGTSAGCASPQLAQWAMEAAT